LSLSGAVFKNKKNHLTAWLLQNLLLSFISQKIRVLEATQQQEEDDEKKLDGGIGDGVDVRRSFISFSRPIRFRGFRHGVGE
jgi:hypothetical protein